jgi:hypothetical protein
MSSESSVLFNEASKPQKIAGVLSFIFAVVSVVLVVRWASKTNASKGYMGGLDHKIFLFNWHPVLMVTGTILCFISSLLAYRVLPLPKLYQKYVHATLHFCAVGCMSAGLAVVFYSSNHIDANIYYSYGANMASMHSFLGIAVFCLYGINFLMGLVFYLLPGIDQASRVAYMPSHIFLGSFLLFAALATVESGIMWMNANCSYYPSSPDTNPSSNYDLLPDGCQLGNSLGVVVFVAVFLCYYAIFRVGISSEQRKHTDVDDEHNSIENVMNHSTHSNRSSSRV